MDVEHYFITVLSTLNEGYGNPVCVVKTIQTEIEFYDFEPQTNVLFTIVAEYQGRVGPKVTIGTVTGNTCITAPESPLVKLASIINKFK